MRKKSAVRTAPAAPRAPDSENSLFSQAEAAELSLIGPPIATDMETFTPAFGAREPTDFMPKARMETSRRRNMWSKKMAGRLRENAGKLIKKPR